MKAKVFISFSSRNRDEAEEIRESLKQAGIDCWMAPHEIASGTDWPRVLMDAIESSPLVLVVLTHWSNDSPNVALEVAHAALCSRGLLVVRTEPIEPTGNIRFFLGLSQRFDALPPPLARHLRKVVDQVTALLRTSGKLSDSPRPVTESVPISGIGQEVFNDPARWPALIRLGRWSLDPASKSITGKGMFNYLLSSRDFGARPFVVSGTLSFDGYRRFAHEPTDTANAGIVFGWVQTPRHHSYLHILFQGQRLLFEAIGRNGGDSYLDFEHIEEGVPFFVEDGRIYEIRVQVVGRRVTVFIDGALQHFVELPSDPFGRVGLRPWRSEMVVRHFEVSEQ